MKDWLIGLPRIWKRTLLVALDLSVIVFALAAAFMLRLGSEEFIDLIKAQAPFEVNSVGFLFIIAPFAVFPFLIKSGLYSTVNRYNGTEVTGSVVRAMTLGVATFLIILFLIPGPQFLPRSVPILWWALTIGIIAGTRYWAGKWLHGDSLSSLISSIANPNYRGSKRSLPVAIYGSGAAGRQLLAALRQGYQYHPAAFIDDDQKLHNSLVSGVRVYSPAQIKKMISRTEVKEVLLAIPSASPSRRKQIIELLEPFGLGIKTMPGMEEIAQGKVKIEGIREISIDDILGRDSVPPVPELFAPCIENKVVLVTGAGGSIGAELCRQIMTAAPSRLVLFENSEYNLYQIDQELERIKQHTQAKTDIVPILGCVTQPRRLNEVVKNFGVQTIYHAAAYKHVPIVEYNSYQGLKNNVLGTLYAAQAAILNKVDNFVLISTDKAVRPTNIMGATKRVSELVLQALSQEPSVNFFNAEKFGLTPTTNAINRTRFTMVRFGNVLDSSGSVIPKFREQIKNGGPVTVTHPDIIRYFMTIPEAAQLVIQAGSLGEGGDVFVLDMGEPVKIDDLAKKLIHLSGLTIRNKDGSEGDIEVEYSGLRPGEKLYEELLIGHDVYNTQHPKIKRANEQVVNWASLNELLTQLLQAFRSNDYPMVRKLLIAQTEIAYAPQDEINDRLHNQVSVGDKPYKNQAQQN
ncbi:MAG: nucleoside-diphosphate sugar epimerase/dehydratase [Porticoccaceae bacterium]